MAFAKQILKWLLLCGFLSRLDAMSCEDWFKASEIDKDAQSCVVQCASTKTAIDTYSCPQRCGDFCKHSRRVWLYFGNGVLNTRDMATYSAGVLEKKLARKLNEYPDLKAMVADNGHVSVAYNVDGSSFDQLAQAFEQKIDSQFRRFWHWTSELSLAPDWFRVAAVKQILIDSDEAFQAHDAELKEHVAEYTSHLKKGDALLVVPHSQGNFYANAAHRILSNKFGVPPILPMTLIPIASPEFQETHEDLINDSPYTTLKSDGVIALIPSHLPANVENHPAGRWDHAFVQHYLNGSSSGPKILQDIACVISRFQIEVPNINTLISGSPPHKACEIQTPYPGLDDNDT